MNEIEKTVSEFQKRLYKLGYEIGEIDGIQGIKTISAIRKFQLDNQLTIDGVVGPQTWKNLISLTS
jgi:peptidoglycan hydrolase-like protein with peptidoglycan-binding domain